MRDAGRHKAPEPHRCEVVGERTAPWNRLAQPAAPDDKRNDSADLQAGALGLDSDIAKGLALSYEFESERVSRDRSQLDTLPRIPACQLHAHLGGW